MVEARLGGGGENSMCPGPQTGKSLHVRKNKTAGLSGWSLERRERREENEAGRQGRGQIQIMLCCGEKP